MTSPTCWPCSTPQSTSSSTASSVSLSAAPCGMSYCSEGRRSTLAALCPSSRSPPTPPFPLCTVGTASGFSGTSPPCHLMGPESPHDPVTCPLNPKHPSSHGPGALLTPGTRTVFQLRLWAATGRPWGALRGPDSGLA